MRKQIIKNDKLKTLLEEKGKLWDTVKKQSDKIGKMNDELSEMSKKMQEVKDKILPIAKEEAKKLKLGEFEQVTLVDVKKGEVIVEIEDAIEALKEKIRADKKKK